MPNKNDNSNDFFSDYNRSNELMSLNEKNAAFYKRFCEQHSSVIAQLNKAYPETVRSAPAPDLTILTNATTVIDKQIEQLKKFQKSVESYNAILLRIEQACILQNASNPIVVGVAIPKTKRLIEVGQITTSKAKLVGLLCYNMFPVYTKNNKRFKYFTYHFYNTSSGEQIESNTPNLLSLIQEGWSIIDTRM